MGVNAQSSGTTGFWDLQGNDQTFGRCFIGTTDNQPLIFKTGNMERMRLLPDKPFFGIGIPTPQATLHLHYQDHLGAPTHLRLLQLTTDFMGNNVSNGFLILSHKTTKDLYFRQQESAKFFIEGLGGGFVVAPTGNIGIGTDAPEEKLHLQGKMVIERTASAASSLQFRHLDPSSSKTYYELLSDIYGLKFLKIASNGPFTSVEQCMIISSTGNIGFGTDEPQQKVHIDDGNLLITSVNSGTSNAPSGALIFADAINSFFSNQWIIEYNRSISTGSGLNFRYYNPGIGQLPGTPEPQYLFLSDNGSIGIGTNNPQSKLDIEGALRAQSVNIDKVLSARTVTVTGGLSANNATIDETLTTDVLNAQDASVTGTLTTSNLSITGNLGLGTLTPNQKLHLKDANFLITRTKSTNSGLENSAIIFDFDYSGGPIPNPKPSKWGIEYVNSSPDGYGLNFWKYDYNSTPPTKGGFTSVMFFNNSNYVGIGTTNPQAQLDVGGSFKARSATVTEKSYFNGDVTVGTANQPAQLEVNGLLKAKTANINGNVTVKEGAFNLSLGNASGSNLNYGTSYIGFNAVRDNGNWTLAGDGANNGGAVIWNTVGGTINFATISSTGTGTKTLTDTDIKNNIKLQLTSAGILKAKDVQVTLTGWPDFVFGKDYKLPTLTEVEHFIAKNNHLPNVPSAADIEANGVNLGEMNAILIQKVEELTLYVIQLEKRLSEVESKKDKE